MARAKIKQKTCWYENWAKLGNNYNINKDFGDINSLKENTKIISSRVKEEEREGWIARAQIAMSHKMYKCLDIRDGERKYLKDGKSIRDMGWIYRGIVIPKRIQR